MEPIPIKIYGKHKYFNYAVGVRTEYIQLATKRDGLIRLITDIDTGWAYEVHDLELYVLGGLQDIEKAMATPEGEEFRGWNNTKQYRLTRPQIYNLVKDKVFVMAGIKMGDQYMRAL